MKSRPLKYAMKSMVFVGLVSTYTIIGLTLHAAGCVGLASAALKRKAV